MKELNTEHPWKTLDCHPLVHVVLQNDAVFSAFLMRMGDGLMLTQDDVRFIESHFDEAHQYRTHLNRIELSARGAANHYNHDIRQENTSCKRTHFPLQKANAITTYKSERATYAQVVYGYDKRHPLKSVYVALSWATSLDRIYLTNTKGDFRFRHVAGSLDRQSIDDVTRSADRPLDIGLDWATTFIRYPNHNNHLTLAALNVQSVHAHVHDLERDALLTEPGVLPLSETWNDEPTEITGFQYVVHSKCLHCRFGGMGTSRVFQIKSTK